MNILVLCTGNSARSILLESILNHTSGGRITAYSAGSHPSGKVHPQSLILLEKKGHNISTARSKSWDEFATPTAPKMDAVITVCGAAVNETCPFWPGAPVRAHWGVDDPADCVTDCETVFSLTYDILFRRAAKLLDARFEEMDTVQLKALLDEIGNS